jgi:Holliday junction resolvase-like predicted endonuclease
MDVEMNLIITLLRLTKDGLTSHELVNKQAGMARELTRKLLYKLQNEGLVYAQRGYIEVDPLNRLKLAVRAINLGGDVENISGFLQWKEFEGIAAAILERNGYTVERNLRFKRAGRRHEIDIVGCKKPIAICIDCKHWRHGIRLSALKTVVKEQVERTKGFAECLPNPAIKIECAFWDIVKIVPAVLSLVAASAKFLEDVPVVPILQLQDFLDQLPAYADSLKHFSVVSHHFKNGLFREP